MSGISPFVNVLLSGSFALAGSPFAGTHFAPGMTYDVLTSDQGGRPVQTYVVTIDKRAPVHVVPRAAKEPFVQGLATVPQMARANDALIATNGAFWSPSPKGNPNGTYVVNGMLESEPESQGTGPRGTIGWTPSGEIIVDRIAGTMTLTKPDGIQVSINGMNRTYRFAPLVHPDGLNAALAYSGRYGSKVSVKTPWIPDPNWVPPVIPKPTPTPTPTLPMPANFSGATPAPSHTPGGTPTPTPTPTPPKIPLPITTVRLKVDGWPSSGQRSATVLAVSTSEGTYSVPNDEVLIQAKGTTAANLATLKAGDTVTIASSLNALDPAHTARWRDVVTAIAGGPRVVANGKVTTPVEWDSEGFQNSVHNNPRHPRTAIGVTADQRLVMVTVDGRQAHSAGMSMGQLGAYLVSLGVTDAVSLDGGGSTQLMVDGQLANKPSDPSLRHVANSINVIPYKTHTTRLAGNSRVATAAKVAHHAYVPGATPTAIIARADAYPDALAGGALAGSVGGPLLLTDSQTLSPETLQAIEHLQSTHIVLLGGTGAISSAIEHQLLGMGKTVVRIQGPSRVDTANAIATQVHAQNTSGTHAFLVSADDWPDALMATPAAGALQSPILLTHATDLAQSTLDTLKDMGIKDVTIVGGTARISKDIEATLSEHHYTVERASGPTRWATALRVHEWTKSHIPGLQSDVIIATGLNYADALAAGPFAAKTRSSLMIVPGDNIFGDPGLGEWLRGTMPTSAHPTVIGGYKAVPTTQILELDALVKGGSN